MFTFLSSMATLKPEMIVFARAALKRTTNSKCGSDPCRPAKKVWVQPIWNVLECRSLNLKELGCRILNEFRCRSLNLDEWVWMQPLLQICQSLNLKGFEFDLYEFGWKNLSATNLNEFECRNLNLNELACRSLQEFVSCWMRGSECLSLNDFVMHGFDCNKSWHILSAMSGLLGFGCMKGMSWTCVMDCSLIVHEGVSCGFSCLSCNVDDTAMKSCASWTFHDTLITINAWTQMAPWQIRWTIRWTIRQHIRWQSYDKSDEPLNWCCPLWPPGS